MPVSYTVNVGVDRDAHAMRLTYLPPECWHFFVPKERALMMSMTSKEAREKMEKARAAVDLCLNMKFWFKERRSCENEKREALLEQVGDMAEKYQIESLVLMNFGMTHADFPRLGATLAKCKELKCLELAQNDFGIGLRGLIEIVRLTSLTTLNLKQVNSRSYLIEIVCVKLTSLTTLNLKQVNSRSYCTLSLADIVGFFPRLEYLSLEGNNLGLTRMGAAVQEIEVRPALKFLCLKENFLRVDGLLRVREVLWKCPGLTHLDLSCNTFRSVEMDVLVGMFSQCRLLSTLNFDGNDMDHEDADLTLAKALLPLESLTDLNLQFNRLGDLLHMGAVLRKCVGLRYLDLGLAVIHDSGATTLAGVLRTCTEVRVLNLSTNEIGVAGTEELSRALGVCVDLKGLNMSNNVIRQRGAEALAGVVGNVRYLSLSNCGIGARGVEALAGVKCEDLLSLDVSGNFMNSVGIQAIDGAAGNWPALESLSISSNALGASGMRAVVRVLAKYTNLTILQLAGNDIQDEGVEILTHGLVQCTTLQELSLTNNNITDAGATCLAGVLPKCTALTELLISYNVGLGSDGERVLREAREGSALAIDVRQRAFRMGV